MSPEREQALSKDCDVQMEDTVQIEPDWTIKWLAESCMHSRDVLIHPTHAILGFKWLNFPSAAQADRDGDFALSKDALTRFVALMHQIWGLSGTK